MKKHTMTSAFIMAMGLAISPLAHADDTTASGNAFDKAGHNIASGFSHGWSATKTATEDGWDHTKTYAHNAGDHTKDFFTKDTKDGEEKAKKHKKHKKHKSYLYGHKEK